MIASSSSAVKGSFLSAGSSWLNQRRRQDLPLRPVPRLCSEGRRGGWGGVSAARAVVGGAEARCEASGGLGAPLRGAHRGRRRRRRGVRAVLTAARGGARGPTLAIRLQFCGPYVSTSWMSLTSSCGAGRRAGRSVAARGDLPPPTPMRRRRAEARRAAPRLRATVCGGAAGGLRRSRGGPRARPRPATQLRISRPDPRRGTSHLWRPARAPRVAVSEVLVPIGVAPAHLRRLEARGRCEGRLAGRAVDDRGRGRGGDGEGAR